MLKHQPALTGVRVSFMAGDLKHLCQQHTPARESFRALRDALDGAVQSGAPTGTELRDWAVLCTVVDEPEVILRWVDGLPPDNRPAAKYAWVVDCVVIPLLEERGRWAEAGRLHGDAMEAFRRHYDLIERIPQVTVKHPEQGDELRESIASTFLASVASLYTALLAANRDADAIAVLEEARRRMPGDRLEAAVAATLSRPTLDG